jgi:hypothetical protein
MEVSTTGVNLTGSPTVNSVAIANTTQVAAKQDTLVSGTNIKTINGTSVLGSGNIAVVTSPSGVAGAIQFSNGSAFASDASNFFWDDTNNRLGVGTNAPTEKITAQTSSAADGISLRDASNQLALIGKWFDSSGFVDLLQNGSAYTRIQASQSYLNTPFTVGSATALSARLGIKGSGSTSATTSLLVQNSAGTSWLQVKDDGDITNGADGNTNLKFEISPSANKFFRLTRQSVNVDFYAGSAGNSAIETSGSAPFLLKASSAALTLSNGGVRIASAYGTTNASAQLEVVSTTKGFLPPVMTTTQKNAIATPAAGLVVYDSTTNKLCCYNGSTWNDLF